VLAGRASEGSADGGWRVEWVGMTCVCICAYVYMYVYVHVYVYGGGRFEQVGLTCVSICVYVQQTCAAMCCHLTLLPILLQQTNIREKQKMRTGHREQILFFSEEKDAALLAHDWIMSAQEACECGFSTPVFG